MPSLIHAALGGYCDRVKLLQQLSMSNAWHAAALGRGDFKKGFPPLHELMGVAAPPIEEDADQAMGKWAVVMEHLAEGSG